MKTRRVDHINQLLFSLNISSVPLLRQLVEGNHNIQNVFVLWWLQHALLLYTYS